MFSLRLIVQEYRATAHHMDRHRRQSSSRPFCATITGSSCHTPTVTSCVSPTLNGAPFCHSFSRSLSWNS
ncbi:protein YoaL [unidentified bacterial endosymbiont]|uniref:protein YoaL n=1 Tax=unidentified bacterial endosymbiont TaxID=2355 RepID=UPI003F50E96D